MNKIELNIGDTIYLEGKEYIIIFYRKTKDYMGESIEIHAKDPLLVQHIKNECELQHRLIQKSEKIIDIGLGDDE